MKIQQAFKYLLLAFVVLTIGWAAIRGVRQRAGESSVPENNETVEAQLPLKLIVYYFHGNKRCKTCRTIERFTCQAVESNFWGELQAGIVELKVVNVDWTENEHFLKDYKLVTRSVVLSRLENGKETRWKNLDKVWKLVGDEYLFSEYIRKESQEMLSEEG